MNKWVSQPRRVQGKTTQPDYFAHERLQIVATQQDVYHETALLAESINLHSAPGSYAEEANDIRCVKGLPKRRWRLPNGRL